MSTGYVYIIKNDVRIGGYKIGKTTDVDRRFNQLKVGTKASIVGVWSSVDYSRLERQLHLMFKDIRIPQSEWFPLSDSELTDAIDYLERRAVLHRCNFVPTEQYRPPAPIENRSQFESKLNTYANAIEFVLYILVALSIALFIASSQ